MIITNSTLTDIEEIFRLYKIATDYQKTKGAVQWPEFDVAMVKTEIVDNMQWKLVIDDEIACVWATTFTDPLIWEEKNNDPSVYIHRIATNPAFRGRNLVEQIVTWSKTYAKQHAKQFVRLDTVGKNEGLIAYYQKCGFRFLGLSTLNNTEGLPAHYHNATVTLFELKV